MPVTCLRGACSIARVSTILSRGRKLIYKEKEKKHKIFDAEVNNNNNNNFFFKFKEKEKVNNEIAALFKKIISKIFKFK